jgi:hypothetical protein
MRSCRSSADLPREARAQIERDISTAAEEKMAISKELLDILACPKCKGDLQLNETKDGLICRPVVLYIQLKTIFP